MFLRGRFSFKLKFSRHFTHVLSTMGSVSPKNIEYALMRSIEKQVTAFRKTCVSTNIPVGTRRYNKVDVNIILHDVALTLM